MKKTKKILSLILVVTMIFALTACGTKDEVAEGTKDTEATEGTKDTEVTAAPDVVKEADSSFKVGIIHIGDPAEGAGYSFAHDQGIVAMQAELGLTDDQIIRKNNVVDTDAVATRTAIEECIEEGCKIIFGTSWGYMETMAELAEEYPDVIFSHATGYMNNGTNMNNYFGRIYQPRYLAGIAAGMKTISNKIGYVAAMDITNSEVTSGINAFALGVESVNPDAIVYVKVTNTWFDPTLEGQAAEALLDMGCDVIAQHQDTTVAQLAAEKRGVWGCGYNTDMTLAAPKAHLTAPIWNWGVYYTTATKAAMDGTWTAVDYFGGMAEGFVDISPLSENCAPGTAEKIEAAKATIVDGSFKIFEGELYDNAGNMVCKAGEVIEDAVIKNSMNWYYKTVVVK